MRSALQALDDEFAFQTSGRFDLLVGEHVAYSEFGAPDVDGALRRSIERAEGVTAVVGRMGSGKSSLIAAVTDSLEEGFVPLRVSVIGVEAGNPAAFARHAITEIRDLPEAQLTRHEAHALDRMTSERRTQTATRELRAGFEIAAGHILTGKVVGDIRQAASEGLERTTDPSHVMRGMQRLFDVFWKLKRCPVMIVEDTDHWGGSPEVADAFFDQTSRAFATMDAVMVVATQSDYTRLNGYQRVRDRLTAEVLLPQLPDVERGLAIVLNRRISSAGVQAPLQDVLGPQGLQLLSQSYLESVTNGQAGDLRRTLAVMRAALDIALAESTAQIVTHGHVQEAMARTPLAPSSALTTGP
jgi:Cdc6-like AAA superfamily ATPase